MTVIRNTSASDPAPDVLLFDGNCGICREWVDYWRRLTGDKIRYLAYQDVASDYPQIPVEDLEQAIHLIEQDGSISKGAKATYRLYRDHPPYPWLGWLYDHSRGFATISESGYRFFSQHRGLLAFLTHLFWGRNFKPARYAMISWLFLRALGCIYLAAFLSFAVQFDLLVGSSGLLPLSPHLDLVRDFLGDQAYLRVPTLFWLNSTDLAISLVCWAGALLSVFLVMGFLVRTSLVLLYVLYLSLVHAGQVFMSFQWDLLLLECGFLAIFLPWGSRITIWLYRWLVFRFMLLSGLVKVMSGDTSWGVLTALNYHFETQPLPTPLAWYAHHLPEVMLQAATGLTLVIELIIPMLLFTPRRFRHFAAWCFVTLQAVILLTGNYNFFNFLSIGLCLFLFDDAAVKKLFPDRWLHHLLKLRLPVAGRVASSCAMIMAAVSITMGGLHIYKLSFPGRSAEAPAFQQALIPFGIVNSYGPFAVMTRERHEIVIEGMGADRTWREYDFRYKPGDLQSCPVWVAPHQPRVDWQMWFAALSTPQREPWFQNLLQQLMEDNKPASRLFVTNPFPESPPEIVRARFYRYTFTTPEARRETGHCWNRQLVGDYFPPVMLR